MSKILVVTNPHQQRVAFHVDRLFAVHSPFKDEKTGDRFDVVVALRTIDAPGLALVPIQESFESIVNDWQKASQMEK